MCTCQVGCRRASGALVDRSPLAAAVLTRRDGANVVLSRNPLLLFSFSSLLSREGADAVLYVHTLPIRSLRTAACKTTVVPTHGSVYFRGREERQQARKEEEEKGDHSLRGEGRGREGERERDGPVAVGAIRCLEPRVVGNHLLGVKNSKLRVDMGLCLHRLQPTTGLRGTDVPVIPVALSLYIYISRFSPVARV